MLAFCLVEPPRALVDGRPSGAKGDADGQPSAGPEGVRHLLAKHLASSQVTRMQRRSWRCLWGRILSRGPS